jgi:hypothetical protein
LIEHVRSKYEELKLYQLHTTDQSIIHEREETYLVYTFLGALNSNYEAIRAQILLSTDKLSFEEVTTHIRQEAARQVGMGTSDLNLKSEAHPFSAHHSNIEKARGKGEIERCAHCKKNDHNQEKCWVLNPHFVLSEAISSS